MSRLAVIGEIAAVVVVLGGLAYVAHMHERNAVLTADLKAANERAAILQGQANLNQKGAEIDGRRARNTSHAATAVQEATHEIDTAPDLNSALAAYSSGLDRVRDAGHAPVSDPQPDRSGSGDGR